MIYPEPYNQMPTAEEAILGMAMYDATARGAMIGALRAENFRVPANRTIFSLIERQHLANRPTDPSTLNALHGQADIAGTLCDIDCKRPITLNPDAFINSLLERDWRDEILNETQKVLSHVERRNDFSIDDLSDKFRARPTATGLGIENPTLVDIADDDLNGRIRDKRAGLKSYLSTGWGQLDAKIHGFGFSTFTVLAGRPGSGKTSLALHFALNALRRNTPTIYCTWEMTEKELLRKMLSSISRVDLAKMLEGDLTDHDVDCYNEARDVFKNYPFTVFNSLPDLETVCAEIRRYKIRKNARLVFVDYLGLIPTRTKHNSPRERMIEITRRMKQLAAELEIPIVGLAQLRRPPPSHQDKAPCKDDLKESGSLEEDADNVLLIWRRYDEATKRFFNNLLIEKARHGETGNIPYKAYFATNSFEEIT